MTENNGPPARFDVIDGILGRPTTVAVAGRPVILDPPAEAAVRKLRRVQYALAPKDGSEPDIETLADASLDLAIAAVRACIPGLDRKRAFRLVLASGGELGELSRTALGLCGIGGEGRAASEDLEDLPT